MDRVFQGCGSLAFAEFGAPRANEAGEDMLTIPATSIRFNLSMGTRPWNAPGSSKPIDSEDQAAGIELCRMPRFDSGHGLGKEFRA